MIYTIYFVLFFLILRFVVTLFNFVSDPKLRRVGKHYHDLVSILIPVRDEQDTIVELLQSIQKQDYPNYEVILLDDQSADNTLKICADFSLTDSRFRIIKGNTLPKGWLGKNYACHQLASQAKGQYLMFVDADERIYDGLINSSVHRMNANNLSLLSLFTNQVTVTIGEKLVVPLMHFILLNLLPVRLVLLVKNASVAAASGQFMFFKADDYRSNNWHQLVKDKIVEDVEIMRQVKANKLNGETLLANGMISCRMYTGFEECLDGFSKNFLAAFNYSIPGFLLFLLLLIGGPMLIIITANFPLMFFTAGLIVLTRIMVSLSSGQNAFYNVILHPLQMVSLVIISFMAIQKHLTKTNIWKGRRV
jgi:glycosyltransferase involved in cell wall biosynthesis